MGNHSWATKSEKGSVERSPRALEVERDLQGRKGANAIERVAKPCGWDFPRDWHFMWDASSEVKKRVLCSGYAVGPRCSSKVLRCSATYVDRSRKHGSGKLRAKTLGWRRSAGEEKPEAARALPGTSRMENPRARGKPKGKRGESKPYGFYIFEESNSEAHENHGSGEWGLATRPHSP